MFYFLSWVKCFTKYKIQRVKTLDDFSLLLRGVSVQELSQHTHGILLSDFVGLTLSPLAMSTSVITHVVLLISLNKLGVLDGNHPS
jgi:hypothetical protein